MNTGPLASSVVFATAARAVAAEAGRRGLRVPAFRSRPGLAGADRTLRRLPAGGSVVAVRLAGRPVGLIVADIVDGVLAANGLTGPAAESSRGPLLTAAARALPPADAAKVA